MIRVETKGSRQHRETQFPRGLDRVPQAAGRRRLRSGRLRRAAQRGHRRGREHGDCERRLPSESAEAEGGLEVRRRLRHRRRRGLHEEEGLRHPHTRRPVGRGRRHHVGAHPRLHEEDTRGGPLHTRGVG